VPPVDLEAARAEVADRLDVEIDDEDLMGYMMYPKVFTDYATRHKDYGPVRTLPTRTFFYGMEPGEEIEAEIDPGVTLVIRLSAVGETNEEGEVRVFFELNGQPRTIRVPNRKIAASQARRPKAEAGNPNHIGAPMPGVVATVAVSAGQKVKPGRPPPDHRGDEDGNRHPRRTRRGGEGRPCRRGRADRRQGPVGGARGLTSLPVAQQTEFRHKRRVVIPHARPFSARWARQPDG
jgi:hypothetical protein